MQNVNLILGLCLSPQLECLTNTTCSVSDVHEKTLNSTVGRVLQHKRYFSCRVSHHFIAIKKFRFSFVLKGFLSLTIVGHLVLDDKVPLFEFEGVILLNLDRNIFWRNCEFSEEVVE